MKAMVESVRRSAETSNWCAALALALMLMLPDVCSNIEGTPGGVGARYTRWCDRWISPIYSDQHDIIIPGGEFYVLRCAYLHEGSEDVSNQQKKDVIERYRFLAPQKGLTVHPRQIGGTRIFQLPIQQFCEIFCIAAESWSATFFATRLDIADSDDRILKFYDPAVDGIRLT